MQLQHNPVNWFEIPVVDLARAKKFYEAVFGIELAPPTTVGDSEMCFFPMEMSAPGAAGSLLKNPHVQPTFMGVTIYFSVPAIDPVLPRIEQAGGSICMPRTDIGQYGFIAQLTDTEGNRVALHERPAM